MGNVTSDHIKPCNIGQSEAHNRRQPEYIARINKKNIYIRQDLSSRNESATTDAMNDGGLQAHYDALAVLVKEKTKRVMQTKVREVVDKRTGKVRKVNGSSPIRESVIVCREDTTIEQLKRYADECHKQFGITALQFHIHRDEGHYEDPEKKVWIPNYHAHIIWDWINHETGKSCKLNGDDTSAMQTLLADCLGMERGKSKADTDATHLEREEFILAKLKREQAEIIEDKNSKASELAGIEKKINEQKAKVAQLQADEERAKAMKQEAESSLETLAEQAQSKQNEIAELDKTIASKNKEADKANGNAILNFTASLVGKGKLGEANKKVAELEAENAKLQQVATNAEKQAKADMEAYRKKLNGQYSQAVKKEVDEATTPLQNEISDLKRKNLTLSNQNVEYQSKVIRLEREIKEKNRLLAVMGKVFYKLYAVFRDAVDALIHFAKAKNVSNYGTVDYRPCLFSKEREAVEKGIATFTFDDNPEDISDLMVETAKVEGKLTEHEGDRAEREAHDVARTIRNLSNGNSYGRGVK